MSMDESLLVKIIGFRATLIHGDSAVLDRWLWLRKRLPETASGEKVVDIGCGTGAFSIGAALRGYEVLGLSWSERNQAIAGQRARLCNAHSAMFDVLDVRTPDTRRDLNGKYDVAICCENIEHIIDDRKLIVDIAACLKGGGRLLLTTPYYHYRPITSNDKGPFRAIEDGGHVRRGYTKAMLAELCSEANLVVEETTYCTGFLSQKSIFVQRTLSRVHPLLGWLAVLPFRIFPPLIDRLIASLTGLPYYSICIEAYKPRNLASGG
jgi:2-polyprenyl-3-methyl-5-hydroxy-6-metoxy-1,4-benzoquinol methylase